MYDGYWIDGKQEGVGIYFNVKGEVRYGVWENGKRLRWISEEEYNYQLEEFLQGKKNV